MQTQVKQAQDFAEEATGYVDCLREMSSAANEGVVIDFSAWGEDAEQLILLEPNAFESLVDIYNDFYSSKRQKGFRASKAAGVKLGRREKELPEKFYAAAELCHEGKMSVAEGAKLCGVPRSTFYKRAKKLFNGDFPNREIPLRAKVVCNQWANGSLTMQEAARKLGISESSFRKLLRDNNISKQYIPDCFDKYYALFIKGKINKKEAAQLCNMSFQKFEACLHRRAQERDKNR
ncbi:MAG: hypothetical protein K5657_04380 [Desulfovibrio sp.]|nr:hypothetical protein [Desulfovibrio sp.]